MTRNGRASACLLASLVVGTGRARAQDRPLMTTEVVQRALERNRDLLAARERVAEAQGLLRQAGVRLAPTVEIEAGTGRPLGTHGEEEYSASYFQPIETAGKRTKRVAVSQQRVALVEAELAQRTRELVFEVKTRVAELQAVRRKADAIARLVTAGRDSFRLTQARVAEGDAAALEERLLATELSRVDAQRATYAGRLTSADLNLRRLIGMVSTGILTVADEPPVDREWSLDALKAQASRARPDLLIARAEEQQAAAELTLTHAEGVPDLTASAKYTHQNTEFEDLYGFTALGARSLLTRRDNVLTVGLSVPIFTAGRNRGHVEAATARASAARFHREYLETTIPQEVEAA
ncbi:MAG TPA: TolC family protein, partial [Vicinamibacterales bacterium]|nr:TolC family protein [Vicinamibacterales bacterium]